MSLPHTPRAKPAVTASEIGPELKRISRRGMLARGLSLGGLALLTGCELSTHSGVDAALWAMLRFNDRVQAALFSRAPSRGDLPGERRDRSVPLQCVLRGMAGSRGAFGLATRIVRPHRRQITMDDRQTARASAGGAGDAAHMHRRLEPDRAVERRATASLSAADRRGSQGPLCLVQMFRRIFDQHRYAQRIAPADHPRTRFPGQAAGSRMGRSGAAADTRPSSASRAPRISKTIAVTNTYPGGYWEDQGYDWFSGS